MFEIVSGWIERRRARKQLCAGDARHLLELNRYTAYYDAQRLAARARFSGDAQTFVHWTAVAAEIARISENPMDTETVKAIVAEEKERVQRSKHDE